jgi:glyoxylase-like metal-dependent hydrolase (beta-lactamase superfamily II)
VIPRGEITIFYFLYLEKLIFKLQFRYFIPKIINTEISIPTTMNPQPENLELIDLDIPQLGYYKFISSWLYSNSEGTFLVDPGPACSIPSLVKKLEDLGVKNLDWILLTHIHQDHAGGLGDLIKKYPQAKVVTHEKGLKHLVDPTKLWEGSRLILGDVAEVYERILPVPQENVVVLDKIPYGSGIKIITTPGHASHHQCFVFSDLFFAGELFGAHIPLDSGLYLRPATPHRFILEDYLRSMDKVEPYLKKNICFAHYGLYDNPREVLNTSKAQLKLWVTIINENKDKDMDEIIRSLLENDKTFRLYHDLDAAMQTREKHFAINSIEGILRYLDVKNL